MSEISNGWIPCTADNEPPEGFRFDVLDSEDREWRYSGLSEEITWASRASQEYHWRPAADDGWTLTDGTWPDGVGYVDIIRQTGDVLLRRHKSNFGWAKCNSNWKTIWWRPAKDVAEKEPTTQEETMSEVNDGWLKCTTGNEPPEGFQFDILVAGRTPVLAEHAKSREWACRVKRGDWWRPAKREGWTLNEGSDQQGLVDYVRRNGVISAESRHAYELSWTWDGTPWTILWWRPAVEADSETVDSPRPSAYRQRVIDEKHELEDRLSKLQAFTCSDFFLLVDGDERGRLTRQGVIMRQLVGVLTERIEAFDTNQERSKHNNQGENDE